MGVATASGTTSAQIDIRVEGLPLNPAIYALLVSAEVDTSLLLPSQFKLVFRGHSSKVLGESGLQLAAEVALQVTTGGAPIPLLTAEVTGVDIEYGPEGRLTIVRGLDKSNRLMRGIATMAYPDMTASDVVEALVADHGIPIGEIVPTDNSYAWLSQPNVSAWTFIQQLAAMEGYLAWVDPLGLFNFGPIPRPQEGPPPVMSLNEPAKGTQLVMGKNLVRLRASVTSAEQVPEVAVTGYDYMQGMPVMGTVPATPSTAQSLDPAAFPAAVAAEFGASSFQFSSKPADTEGQAMSRARFLAAEIAGAMAELEGECLGNPAVLAGKVISLGMAGQPFDGQYLCSSARHVFEPFNGGYTTRFTVGGLRDRTLFSLTSGGGGDPLHAGRFFGVVVATVVDNLDEEDLGRVKVRFEWLSNSYVSAWARTVQMGAGNDGGYGFLFVPEVGDEVLVAFDRGDLDHPYVIGGLYNGMSKPQPAPEIQGMVANRRISSRLRHTIQFNDGPEQNGMLIKTGDDSVSITLDADTGNLLIKTDGEVTIQSEATMLLRSGTDISIEASGSIALQAEGQVSVKSGDSFSVDSGEGISMSAGGSVSVSGPDVSISSPEVSLGA